jgi:hypothetical protein
MADRYDHLDFLVHAGLIVPDELHEMNEEAREEYQEYQEPQAVQEPEAQV